MAINRLILDMQDLVACAVAVRQVWHVEGYSGWPGMRASSACKARHGAARRLRGYQYAGSTPAATRFAPFIACYRGQARFHNTVYPRSPSSIATARPIENWRVFALNRSLSSFIM